MQTQRTFRSLFLIAFALVLTVQAVAVACPLCKDSVPLDDASRATAADSNRTARGYAWSILLLIAMPFGMVGAAAMLLVSNYRRTLAGHQVSNPARTAPHPTEPGQESADE